MVVAFSSPFLGTFFQWCMAIPMKEFVGQVFVPFLGDFLSICEIRGKIHDAMENVFVPFLGDFLSIRVWQSEPLSTGFVFVPFLGDFLSIRSMNDVSDRRH